MSDDVKITLTDASIKRVNVAVRAFHKSEADHTAEALKLLIGDAVKLATVVQPIRHDFLIREQASNAKAKPASAKRLSDLLGATFEGTASDLELALSIPCGDSTNPYAPDQAPSEAATVALMVTYRARCTSKTDDDGISRSATVPSWPGFRSFLSQAASFRRANGYGKFDSKSGMLTDGAKKLRDDAATASESNAATIIASPFWETMTAAHSNDPVEAAAAVRCIIHDAQASLAKLSDNLSEAQLKAVTKRYHELLVSAKTTPMAPALVTP